MPRAIAGATRRRQFELSGAVDASEALFDLFGERHAVVQPETAEIAPDTAFAGPVPFAPGVARRHAEITPDGGQLVLGDSDKVNVLATGQLHQLNVEFHRDSRNAHQLIGCADAAWYLGDNRKSAILLDVSVYPVIDEAGVAFVFIFCLPNSTQQRRQCGLARCVFASIRQRGDDAGDGFEARFPDRLDLAWSAECTKRNN